jgi:acyl carrier protein
MSHDEIERQVREALAMALQCEIPAIGEVRRDDVPEWDSFKQVELVFLLEDTFGLEFSEQEMAELSSLSMIVNRIEARLAA